MEHAISEIIKIFTTMIFILLLVGMVIMGKHLSDVNSFKEYVNTQIERNGGYTQTVKTNVEKTNKDSFNNMFVVYEPDSNTPKKIEDAHFGEIVNYEIHSDIPIPFTTAGTIKIPIAFKGQAVSRIRDSADIVKHTAYSWSADGTDGFTTTKPNSNLLGGTSQNLSIQGNNSLNQRSSGINQLYYFANGQNLFQQNIGLNTKVKVSFDWKATPTTETLDSLNIWSSFKLQYNDLPWGTAVGLDKTQIHVTPTNSSGHVDVTFPSADVENMSSAIAAGIEMRLNYIPSNINITISNLKYEISQPKYIGTYTDKSKTDSKDPSKYTWKLNPDYH